MKKKILILQVIPLTMLLLFLQFVNWSLHAAGPDIIEKYASQTVYTIQAGSFIHFEDAQRQFDAILQEVPKQFIDYLRIEKIGDFYTVRNGIFEDRMRADAFLPAMKSKFTASMVRTAYIERGRIRKMYIGNLSDNTMKSEEENITETDNQEVRRDFQQEIQTISIPEDASKIYTLETGYFMHYGDAEERFASIVEGAISRELAYSLDYLRIEKIGESYAVRIGNFRNRSTAEKFLQAFITKFPSSVMLRDHIHQDRILKLYQ